MKEWLEPIGCIQYLGVLLDNGYDMESLSDLGGPSEDDLDKMGIKARMDRRKLSSLYHFPRISSKLKSKSDDDAEESIKEENDDDEDEDSSDESDSSENSDDDEEEEEEDSDEEDDSDENSDEDSDESSDEEESD